MHGTVCPSEEDFRTTSCVKNVGNIPHFRWISRSHPCTYKWGYQVRTKFLYLEERYCDWWELKVVETKINTWEATVDLHLREAVTGFW